MQTTVYRLEEKKALRRVRKIGNAHIFEPLVTKRSAFAALIDDFIGTLGGSEPLVAHLVETGKISSAELKQIDQARTELIALVTHELRTPLAVVRAYTDLLAEEPDLSPDRPSRDPERRDRRAAWYQASMEQVERLDRLVDSILASVRVVPEEHAEVVPTDVPAVVGEVVAELEPLLRNHEIGVEGSVPLHALADASRLRQILEHLVENAVKYAPPQTRITLAWRMVEGDVRFTCAFGMEA